MNNFFKKLTQEEEISVNITSMIDVIFILLIFFMVSTQFKKNSLPLNLPKTEEETVKQEDKTLHTLSVNHDKLELDGENVAFDELETVLTRKYEENPETVISLECEKTVEFERIVQILTKIQNAGISKIGIVHETLD